MFLFPDTRHPTPETLRFSAWDLGFQSILGTLGILVHFKHRSSL